MNPTTAKWMRKWHRHVSFFIALPIVVILLSGLLLQWKKEVAWIQPPTMRGSSTTPSVSMQQVLDAASSIPEASITSWDDIDRLDVRPSRGVVKVRGKSGNEVQVDAANGEVLQVMRRRSDLIESIHDGSFFHARAKHWLFFPVAIGLLFLWISGMYLWALHVSRKRPST